MVLIDVQPWSNMSPTKDSTPMLVDAAVEEGGEAKGGIDIDSSHSSSPYWTVKVCYL